MDLQGVEGCKGLEALAYKTHAIGRNSDEDKPGSSRVIEVPRLDAVKPLKVFVLECIPVRLVDEAVLAKRVCALAIGDLLLAHG